MDRQFAPHSCSEQGGPAAASENRRPARTLKPRDAADMTKHVGTGRWAAHRSQMIGAPRASTTSITASVTSGPMPSPGIRVTVCGLPSPGSGTYVIRPRAPALTNWRTSAPCGTCNLHSRCSHIRQSQLDPADDRRGECEHGTRLRHRQSCRAITTMLCSLLSDDRTVAEEMEGWGARRPAHAIY